ncbi:MAG: hypothetical protein H6658_08470 [Ardenticatenaceae bacterium]|nr:hypothetical protein [Ardenticatenaceae bacterium]
MTLLEDITLQTKRLTYSDQLKLIAYLAEQLQLQQPALSTRRRWQEIAGSASYPLAGEDAQSWVSRSRQENDNEREKQYRSGA